MAINAAALTRALNQGIKARRVSPRCWMVTSSDGQREYEVCPDGAIRCQCPAGTHNRPCKHLALVEVLAASGAVPVPECRVDPAEASLAAAILGGEG